MPEQTAGTTNRLSVWGHSLLNKLSSRSRKRRKRSASKLRRTMDADELFDCPCCQNATLTEPPPGTFEICEICGWEDDHVQYQDPSFAGGANRMSLEVARAQYKSGGASKR